MNKRYERVRNAENVAHRKKLSAEDKYIEMYYVVKHMVARINHDFNSHGEDFDAYIGVRDEQIPLLEKHREALDAQQRGVYHFYDMAAAARSKDQQSKADSWLAKAERCQRSRNGHLEAIAQSENALDAAMKKARKGSPMANLFKLIKAGIVWRRAESKLRYYEAKENRLGAKKAKMGARLDARLEAAAAEVEAEQDVIDGVSITAVCN